MNVLINAITIRDGGGLVVLKNLLEVMIKAEPNTKWYVAANPQTLSQLSASDSIVALPYAWIDKTPLHLFFWYEVVLPKLIRQFKIDICFSQTNVLPRRKLSCPTLLLIQQAGFFSEKFTELYFQCYNTRIKHFLWKQRIKWSHRSIKTTTAVTVQTNALAQKICEQSGIPKSKISVIPHGPGLLRSNVQIKQKEFSQNTIWRIGYITKFGVQKDFNTAFKAIKILKDAGVKTKLIITLDTNTYENKNVLKAIYNYDIEDRVENFGEVNNSEKINAIYESLDFFIFPSLCESFGFTLVEAMAAGLPVIAADTESNREIVGIESEFFPPEDAEKLAEKIYRLISARDLYIQASKNSIVRSKAFSWERAGKDITNVMCAMLPQMS